MSTNEEAVQVLKEAMESPSWWTNRAGLTAREVVRRLEELGYTVARSSDVRAAPTAIQAGAAPVPGESASMRVASAQAAESDELEAARAQDQARIASLMAEVESSISAAREARQGRTESPLPQEQRESA